MHVGYVFLHMILCVCAQALNHIQLFLTSWTVARQALFMKFSRQEYRRSSLPQAQTLVSSVGRQILYHGATLFSHSV